MLSFLKLFSFLNPSHWGKQTALLIAFAAIGWLVKAELFTPKCPECIETQINNDIDTKGNSKKGGTTTIDLGLSNDQSNTDCYTRSELLEMGVKERQLNKAGVK